MALASMAGTLRIRMTTTFVWWLLLMLKIWSAAAKNIGPQISKTLMECGMSRSFSASPGVISEESVYFHALMSAVSAIRFINNSAASTTPISIATTRSKKTVRKKVATRTIMSLLGAVLQRRKKEVQSAIFAATTKRTAANVVIGIRAARGIKTRRMMVSVIQCTIPAIGVRPPLRTLAAVLAIAPVAGIPPNNPEKIFPSPWPISSALDLCVSPIIPSETTAESKDSIPAKIAIVKAGESIS